jgi:alpha-tubulin suppressor-like RCC1 family protein
VSALLASGCDYVFRLDEVPDRPKPDAPSPIVPRWTQVAAGYGHTCAIDDIASLWCWGRNHEGAVGAGMSAPQIDVPIRISSEAWNVVSTSYRTMCGIKMDGSLWCWGWNYSGLVGDGSRDNRALPVQIDAGPWRRVATATDHTCGVKDDGSLWCWGANDVGQLGDASTTARTIPTQIATTKRWVDVSTGTGTSCAIDDGAKLWCWGNNASGQFGTGNSSGSTTPIQVGSTAWARIGVGYQFTCGITLTGLLQCAGSNQYGQLGDGGTATRATHGQTSLFGRMDFVDLAVGSSTSCARTQDGQVLCWGLNDKHLAGVATGDAIKTPTELVRGLPWAQVAMGADHMCAVGSDNTLWCVGANGYSQLADGGTSSRTPVRVPGSWRAVQTGLRGPDGCGVVLRQQLELSARHRQPLLAPVVHRACLDGRQRARRGCVLRMRELERRAPLLGCQL